MYEGILNCFGLGNDSYSNDAAPRVTVHGFRVYATLPLGSSISLEVAVQEHGKNDQVNVLQLASTGTSANPAHVAWAYPVYALHQYNKGVTVANGVIFKTFTSAISNLTIDVDAEIVFEFGLPTTSRMEVQSVNNVRDSPLSFSYHLPEQYASGELTNDEE